MRHHFCWVKKRVDPRDFESGGRFVGWISSHRRRTEVVIRMIRMIRDTYSDGSVVRMSGYNTMVDIIKGRLP